ncbi:O-antigen ligase family protein [Myxococcus sp. MxC21-1]|uniref:O-antigen ligase family protein n=1 Tax=Myxococcus sp. MxC21-1 TaxID=3041439 RepID=UPI00292E37AD|nr:O-antigen ligase family protein [Myxococcus sp. MxC21-1]WNZ63314.1 O-antigen ligase family protein [Myxococcus sp. MxC21-1]
MPRASRSASRFTLFAEAALAALVVVCPLALGGAAGWLLGPLVLLSGAAAVLATIGAKRQGQSLRVPLLAVPLAMGAGLCAVQLVPLPDGVLRLLSPEAAALREFALVPLGLERARPVSLDPSATWRELAKHLAYLLAFLATVQVTRSRGSRERLLAAVVFTGAGLTVVGLGHALLGVKSLFGLMHWMHARPTLVTPFGNPNHLAGFLALASTLGVGLSLTRGQRSRALPYALAAGVSGLGVVLSLSRGGIAFFAFGQALLALFLLRNRRASGEGAPPVWARSAAALLGLLGVLMVGAYTAADSLWAEARTADSVEKLRQSKVALWPMLADAARAFPVLGMGRGAFEAAFPRYQSEPNPNTFTHPENAVLQVAAELGALGLVLLAVAVWGFLRLLRREGLETVDGGARGRGGAGAARPLRFQLGIARVRGSGVGGAGRGGASPGAGRRGEGVVRAALGRGAGDGVGARGGGAGGAGGAGARTSSPGRRGGGAGAARHLGGIRAGGPRAGTGAGGPAPLGLPVVPAGGIGARGARA